MPQKPFSTPVQPDIDELLAVLRREGAPKRVHHIELFLDPEIIEAVDRRYGLCGDLDRSDPFHTLERQPWRVFQLTGLVQDWLLWRCRRRSIRA